MPGDFVASPFRRPGATAPEWVTLATAGNVPTLLARRLGRGRVYFLNARMAEYPLASVLSGILGRVGVPRLAEVVRTESPVGTVGAELEPNIEVRKFANPRETGYFLFNWDGYAKTVRFRSPETRGLNASVRDPLAKKTLALKDGYVTVSIPSNGKRILVIRSGPPARPAGNQAAGDKPVPVRIRDQRGAGGAPTRGGARTG